MSFDPRDSDSEGDDPPTEALSDREKALVKLNNVTEFAEYKIFGKGQLRDPERERLRIKYLNTIVSAANAKRALLKDRDLDDLADRIAELEEQKERAKYR